MRVGDARVGDARVGHAPVGHAPVVDVQECTGTMHVQTAARH